MGLMAAAFSAAGAASWGLCLCSPLLSGVGRLLVPAPGGRRGVTGQKRVQCYCVMFWHSGSWGLTVTPNFGTLGGLCGTDAFQGGCGGDCET